MPEENPMVQPFDEYSLRRDIARVWGEHGAHIAVFDHMLRLLYDSIELMPVDDEDGDCPCCNDV